MFSRCILTVILMGAVASAGVLLSGSSVVDSHQSQVQEQASEPVGSAPVDTDVTSGVSRRSIYSYYPFEIQKTNHSEVNNVSNDIAVAQFFADKAEEAAILTAKDAEIVEKKAPSSSSAMFVRQLVNQAKRSAETAQKAYINAVNSSLPAEVSFAVQKASICAKSAQYAAMNARRLANAYSS